MRKDLIAELVSVVGESNVITDPEAMAPWGCDWTKLYTPNPSAVVFPRTTAEVSRVLRFCNDNSVAVVPSGGRTGLAGAAVANNGEVVLSLTKMNKIIKVDTAGLTITTEPGVITQQLQQVVADAGFFFPIDLAAKGSCHIGGNAATNAGGLKFIRYGGTRDQILGLEVVLANGDVLDLDTDLRKNNTGYDLKQLFIGSEGTLGVITRLTIRLMPRLNHLDLACLAVDSFAKIPKMLSVCFARGVQPTAFEFFTAEAHKAVLSSFPKIRTPFADRANYYVLIEAERHTPEDRPLEKVLEHFFAEDLAQDGVVSTSQGEFKELWSLRENIPEAVSLLGLIRKNDISIGVAKLGEFVAEFEKLMATAPKELSYVIFGHIGDGNIHINYVSPKTMERDTFFTMVREVESKVFALLQKFRGSISAEHGIGLLKKADLHFSCTPLQVSLMQQIKKTFDPKGILNPGKIFDMPA